MKKIISFILLIIVLVNSLPAQKVVFSLTNRTIASGYLSYNLQATIPAGQFWAVGAATIRFNLAPNPLGALTIKEDNPVLNANSNISNANGYQPIKTVKSSESIMSFNILTFNSSGFYRFNSGTYSLGTIRFNVVTSSFATDSVRFRVNPPFTSGVTTVNDSLVPLVYGITFSVVQPEITGIISAFEIPISYELYQNYPNPFNPYTIIKYDISKKSIVKIGIYDITGKLIDVLVNKEMELGRYEVSWNALNYSSSVYFCKINANEYCKIIKMVLLK